MSNTETLLQELLSILKDEADSEHVTMKYLSEKNEEGWQEKLLKCVSNLCVIHKKMQLCFRALEAYHVERITNRDVLEDVSAMVIEVEKEYDATIATAVDILERVFVLCPNKYFTTDVFEKAKELIAKHKKGEL